MRKEKDMSGTLCGPSHVLLMIILLQYADFLVVLRSARMERNACDILDGILCGEDLTAAGVLKALLRAGIRVPEETAVVGYDNSTYARLCEPELTSVDNKPEQVALLCVQLLQSRIEHGEDYSSVTLQPELVQRQSS